MRLFDIIAVTLALSAVFSWLNYRLLKLPTTIGLMLIALVLSLVMLIPLPFTDALERDADAMLARIDFDETVLHGMLSLLLFAGALHVKIKDLASQKWAITILATASVVGSTFLVGFGAYQIFSWLGLQVPLVYCLIFGALISPTDPIAVLGILKEAGAPEPLEIKITGEALFNDGVAVVVFLALLQVAVGDEQLTTRAVLELFAHEALGGVAFGLAVGTLGYFMLKHVDNYQVEVLITLGLATGGYSAAEHLGLSAPIAVVISGLVVGNHGRGTMSPTTQQNLDTFWELVDEVLNATLFVLIGLEVLVLTLKAEYLLAGLCAIPLVLAARMISVGLPIGIMRHFRSFSPGVVTILTWGGLRGGISVALALSLPPSTMRDTLVTVTYVVVVFSILVQGLTLAPLIKAKGRRAAKEISRTKVGASGAD